MTALSNPRSKPVADMRLLCAALQPEPRDPGLLRQPLSDPSIRESLLQLARRERVMPALKCALSSEMTALFTHTEKVILATAHEANRRRNKSIREAIVNIAACAAQAGFAIAPLKGARWFFTASDPFAAWRTMHDADLLADPARVRALPPILESLGFEAVGHSRAFGRARTYRTHFHLEPYINVRSGVIVEVHRHVGFRSELLTRSQMLDGAVEAAPGLWLGPAWCAAFHAMIHWQAQHDGYGRMTCPVREVLELSRQLADGQVDWERVAAHARSVDAMRPCVAALDLTRALLGSQIPAVFAPSAAATRRTARCLEVQASDYSRWKAIQRGRAVAHLKADRMRYALLRRKWPRVVRAPALWLYRAVALPVAGWRALHMTSGVIAKTIHAPWFETYFLGRAR